MTAPETGPIAGGAPAGGESGLTVVIAFAANLLIAVAKTAAAVMTGAASMLALAATAFAYTAYAIVPLAIPRSLRPWATRVSWKA